jgi:hypothetical protein
MIHDAFCEERNAQGHFVVSRFDGFPVLFASKNEMNRGCRVWIL